MATRIGHLVRYFLAFVGLAMLVALSLPAGAAPYAAYVMDARTGETLFAENASTKLHPASLTKMMTLYIAFQEIESGRLSLETMITVSANAAAQPPSRLGLKTGQKIALRHLIRAAAVKSANDAASAIGDAIGGSTANFAARMTKTAHALGMKNTTFKNANGLTAKGHLSTAQDMSILGRRLFYDFPQYYNIFSRRSTDAGIATVSNTNRRFLDAYKGADGIKTGYTDAAGFNLTASAERGGVRIIATVFGGKTTADRNAKISKLMDLGFAKAPGSARTIKPDPLHLDGADADLLLAQVDGALPEVEGGAGKTLRVTMTVASSPRPLSRPDPVAAAAAAELVASLDPGIDAALLEATAGDAAATLPAVDVDGIAAALSEAGVEAAPRELTISAAVTTASVALVAMARPPKRNKPIYAAPEPKAEPASAAPAPAAPADTVQLAADIPAPETAVITRVSTSGGRQYGINVGRYTTSYEAEGVLLKVQLRESATLAMGLRKVVLQNGGWEANFLGLTEAEALLACRKLAARQIDCTPIGA
ncbi:MAG: D-alanyl-D-alanine carboxypeptidase family protein [Paracoccaceae bacterium]